MFCVTTNESSNHNSRIKQDFIFIHVHMKKILLSLFAISGLFLLTGCSLTETTVNSNSKLNEQISLLQKQIIGLNSEIQELKNDIEQYKQELTQEQIKNSTCNENINNTITTTNTTSNSDSRYRKIYSNDYSIYKKDNSIYNICLAWNKDICIDLIQYNGTIWQYLYNYVTAPEDKQYGVSEPTPNLVSTYETSHKNRNQVRIHESNVYYTVSGKSTLIMVVSDQKGEGFHGGEYNPKNILNVIDF